MFAERKENALGLDSAKDYGGSDGAVDLDSSKRLSGKRPASVLFSRNRVISEFFTEDSKLYLTQEELSGLRAGRMPYRPAFAVDSAIFRRERRPLAGRGFRGADLYAEIRDRYSNLEAYLKDLFAGSVRGVGVMRMWNVSMIASIVFGMFLMTMIYRYLGVGASAGMRDVKSQPGTLNAQVLGAEASKEDAASDDELTAKLLAQYENSEQNKLEEQMLGMVKGYPIEKMVPYIAKKDKVVAAFLIGIARKESSWGQRVPVLDGEDCYNYWGYRGKRDRMGTGGHTCFDSPEDAVNTVAKRIEFLVSNEKINTPEKMVTVWKCGYDCSWDSQTAVRKWVSDVDIYFKKLNID